MYLDGALLVRVRLWKLVMTSLRVWSLRMLTETAFPAKCFMKAFCWVRANAVLLGSLQVVQVILRKRCRVRRTHPTWVTSIACWTHLLTGQTSARMWPSHVPEQIVLRCTLARRAGACLSSRMLPTHSTFTSSSRTKTRTPVIFKVWRRSQPRILL